MSDLLLQSHIIWPYDRIPYPKYYTFYHTMSIGSYCKRPHGIFSSLFSFLHDHVRHRFDYRIASFLADVELFLVTVVVEPAVVDAFRVPATAPHGHAVLVLQVVVRFVRQPVFEQWSHGGIWKKQGTVRHIPTVNKTLFISI